MSTVRSEEVSSSKALGHHFSIFLLRVPGELDKTRSESARLELTNITSGVQKPQKELQEDCLAPRAPCPPWQTGLNLIPGLNKPGNLQSHSQACDGRYGQFLCPKAALEAHSGLLLQLNEPHRRPEVALSPSLSEMVGLGLIYGTCGKWPAGTTHGSWPSEAQAAAPCTFPSLPLPTGPVGPCLGTGHMPLLPCVCSALDQRAMSPSL